MSAFEYEHDRPWVRQPCDSDFSYQLFQDFLTAGPQRSIAQVARKHALPVARVYDMAHDGLWKERAEAWDRHIEQMRLSAIEDEIQETAKDVAKRHGRLLQRMFKIGESEIAKLEKNISQGDFLTFSISDLLRWIDKTMDKERLLHGQATERIETGPNLDNLTLDELRQLEEMQRRAGVRE